MPDKKAARRKAAALRAKRSKLVDEAIKHHHNGEEGKGSAIMQRVIALCKEG